MQLQFFRVQPTRNGITVYYVVQSETSFFTSKNIL